MSANPFLTFPAKIDTALPLFREWGYAFGLDGHMAVSDGRLTLLSGQEACKVWIYKALLTIRDRYRAYTPRYGSELEQLIGTIYSPAASQAEADRMVRECLMQFRYITQVRRVLVDWADGHFQIYANVATVYGELDVDTAEWEGLMRGGYIVANESAEQEIPNG